MKYRTFRSLDWKVSALGFGAMRLPILNGDPGKIDEVEAVRMIRYAIDQGVNYIDTAYPYHRGNSEIVVGKALAEGYRQRVKLATKMPTWLITSVQDMDRYLEEQLTRLGTHYVDFYLLHGLRKERWQNIKELNVFEWAEKAKKDGKIKYLGFSFHDEYDVFKQIVDSYHGWTFCQIQYNYMDTEFQAGTKGLKYAASKGLAIVVMEPLAGGMLASNSTPEIQAIWDKASRRGSPADWALQWVWNQPEVSVVLSGMTTMPQVIENIQSANRSGIHSLSDHDLKVVSQVKTEYLKYGVIGCSNCKYCLPCPEGVDIPEVFILYNEYFIKNRDEKVIDKYSKIIPFENRAGRCAKCGRCEEMCPQKISIRNILGKVAFLFEK